VPSAAAVSSSQQEAIDGLPRDQWATGPGGRAAIEGILAHPELELAGAWVHDPAKAGRDVGELCGIGPLGVAASADAGALLAEPADCVLYAPLLAKPAEVARILESGKNVVTPLNWFYPNKAKVADLEQACQKGGVTLHGTGIHPGGITERFPLVISALARSHTCAPKNGPHPGYGAPQVIGDVMGFGKAPEQARTSRASHAGARFLQSLYAGRRPGLRARSRAACDARARRRDDRSFADQRDRSRRVAAQRYLAGDRAGEPVLTARVNWLMGEEHLRPGLRRRP
jgi:hypothetical protein